MIVRQGTDVPLAQLYEQDETAWLEAMSRLAADGRADQLDLENLSEFLDSMARRDKRELLSRLTVLLTHLLKWEFQPDKRTASWEVTINHQKRELADMLTSGTLRNHAERELAKVYAWAVRDAAIETSLPEATFPPECPYTLDAAVSQS